jgi:hypothetical protein
MSHTIRVDYIVMWVGGLDKLPTSLHKYKELGKVNPDWPSLIGPFDIAFEDFVEASKEKSIAIIYSRPQQSSKKEIAKGAKVLDDEVLLAVDEKYARFHQR